MTLEIKQAKVQWYPGEQKWHKSGLTVHREIYVKQRNLVSFMVSMAKKDYLCQKLVNCGSSWELFCLSSQIMGIFQDTMLSSNISHKSLPDKFNEFFVRKIEEIRLRATLCKVLCCSTPHTLTECTRSACGSVCACNWVHACTWKKKKEKKKQLRRP